MKGPLHRVLVGCLGLLALAAPALAAPGAPDAAGDRATARRPPEHRLLRSCAAGPDSVEAGTLRAELNTPRECAAVVSLLDAGPVGCGVLRGWLDDRAGACGPAIAREVAVQLVTTGDDDELATAAALALDPDPAVARPVSTALNRRLPVLSAPFAAALLSAPDPEVQLHAIQMLAGLSETHGPYARWGPAIEPAGGGTRLSSFTQRDVARGPVPAAHLELIRALLLAGERGERRMAADVFLRMWPVDLPAAWFPVLAAGLRANLDDPDVWRPLAVILAHADPGSLVAVVDDAADRADVDLDRVLADRLGEVADRADLPADLRLRAHDGAALLKDAAVAAWADGGDGRRAVRQFDVGGAVRLGASPTAARAEGGVLLLCSLGPHHVLHARFGLGATSAGRDAFPELWDFTTAGWSYTFGTAATSPMLGVELGARLWSPRSTVSVTPALRAGVELARHGAHRDYVIAVFGLDVPVWNAVAGVFPTGGLEVGFAF